MALLSHYPFKALYTLYSICHALLTLPVWLTTSIVPWTRPNRQWTVVQAIRMQIVSRVLHFWSVIELNTPTPLKPGREGRRFTVAKPGADELYTGALDDPEIRPGPVGLTWTKDPITKGVADFPKGATVILHLHGGAFVIGDGRDHDTGFLAATLVRHFGGALAAAAATARPETCVVVTPQYRLSCRPGARFPAALQDALTSYLHLVRDLGIPAAQIVVSGDSAGGNLALGLLRYIIDEHHHHGMPVPGAVLLWSPWTDVAAAQDPAAIYQSPQYRTDYLSGAFGSWGARAYTAATKTGSGSGSSSSVDPRNPYISPLHSPFRSPVPIWIHAGGAEVLLQDCEELQRRMRKAIDVAESVAEEEDGQGKEKADVELYISPRCPHDILLVGAMAGFKAEARDAAKQAAQFWRRVRQRA
ncbi:Alpha/Beta hydrolase protein [Microdochium bolleyi]|uniref:Alpha/Beta hydrolase protein n=1 Tax=Microdochium bolleyi TaxID=196109 RepID=A0A136IR71_9PEZI|nr:Alpha/Beta hydrolase protein [Microdochium bolleyi]